MLSGSRSIINAPTGGHSRTAAQDVYWRSWHALERGTTATDTLCTVLFLVLAAALLVAACVVTCRRKW